MLHTLVIAHRVCPALSATAVGFKSKREMVEACAASMAAALKGVNYRLAVILDGCPEYAPVFLPPFSPLESAPELGGSSLVSIIATWFRPFLPQCIHQQCYKPCRTHLPWRLMCLVALFFGNAEFYFSEHNHFIYWVADSMAETETATKISRKFAAKSVQRQSISHPVFIFRKFTCLAMTIYDIILSVPHEN